MVGKNENLNQYKKIKAKELKHNLLREAYQEFVRLLKLNSDKPSTSVNLTYLSQDNYTKFQTNHKEWLQDYVLYRALKAHFEEAPWFDWEPEIASRETKALSRYSLLLLKEMGFIEFLQYTFFYEWDKLKTYARAKGVQVVGDLPHFVAADSCDVWVNRTLFKLDKQGRPAKTAGVPPDYFSSTGQLWGNPVYDWDAHAATQYAWWKMRIKVGLEQFGYIRLDHFRGFEAFWEVDAQEETAEKGRWIKGPGKRFFESLIITFGKCPFIVEDLGVITTEVNILKQIFSFPGIKVLQFTPQKKLLMNAETNFVYYTGTHDNNTLLGWYEANDRVEDTYCDNRTIDPRSTNQQACRKLIEETYLSQAAWVILPMQDILGLGKDARMNVPGTIHGNWKWQLDKNYTMDEIKVWLRSQAERSDRVN